MKIIALFICLISLKAQAGGYVTADIYNCSQNGQKFELAIGATESIILKGDSIGTCKGRAWVGGGGPNYCLGKARFEMDNKCQADVSELSWKGCFMPARNFDISLNHLNNSQSILKCTLVKRGGSFYMDGTPK